MHQQQLLQVAGKPSFLQDTSLVCLQSLHIVARELRIILSRHDIERDPHLADLHANSQGRPAIWPILITLVACVLSKAALCMSADVQGLNAFVQ